MNENAHITDPVDLLYFMFTHKTRLRAVALCCRHWATTTSRAPNAADSEDDDVVVVTSPGSTKKAVPQADKDRASPPSTGPGAAAKKVQVVEVDDDDDESDVEVQVGRVSSEDEGEVMEEKQEWDRI